MTFQDAQSVHIFCKGHNGGNIGTWAYVLNLPNTTTHKSGHGTQDGASHNLMEIEACIGALNALNRPCHVTIFTNSMYLKGGIALLADGTHYDTNILAWQRFLNAGRGHVIDCEHVQKVHNSGYMRLADSIAMNLLPPQFRRLA